ncbi:MAG: class I tRNA ligase family protein, partial [Verrucomicrobia bacterium]|nr:class I tRNA ligase family protein [Verrucomicrobiota bacterium]
MSTARSYKDTLRLPQTEFPMKANLVAREPEILRRWQEADVYGRLQTARKNAPEFLLHDGPPFANGDVHMGTALNKILKDLVVKSKAMAGFRAPFLPGWDCHGLPIEFKVVKQARGLSPLEVRRKSEAMARGFIETMTRQFQRLGVFGEWAAPYRTLDPDYEAEIVRAFGRFVERGLVYRSKKPVYWSTGAQTALAEAEVEYHERDDAAIYVKFPLVSGPLAGRASVVIWTTTPWTLPANVAIALNPAFRYSARVYKNPATGELETLLLADGLAENFCKETGYAPAAELSAEPATQSWLGKELDGWPARHPFLERDALFILGEHVTLDAGTGAVHTAPGHGAEDYVVGRQYGLPVLSPVDDLGKFTDEVGVPALVGKYVFDANADVIALLRARGALAHAGTIHHTYPHCWRSKTPIVFRAVEQFFIKMDTLRPAALRAI